MSDRKTPILLRRGPLSGRVVALTRYTRGTTASGHEMLKAATNGKHDVSGDFDALLLEELFGPDDDCPDIIGILDGAADGATLPDDERAQVRAFRERFRAIVERHNERIEGLVR